MHGEGSPNNSFADKKTQPKSVRNFVLSLQQALRNGDRKWVIDATRYPVQFGEIAGTDQAFLNNYKNAMLDQSTFVAKYDAIWSPERIKVVIRENPDHFNPNNTAFSFGCGEVVVEKLKDSQFKITGFDISEYSIAGMSIHDCYQVRSFLSDLQAAITINDRKKVAGMLKYPIRYNAGKRTITFRSAQELLLQYDSVFSASLRQAITGQKYWNLIGGAEGIGIEGGYIWISSPSQNGSFYITNIVAPPEE